MSLQRSALRIQQSDPAAAPNVPQLIVELNRILGLLQQGGAVLSGFRMDLQRSAAPTIAPTSAQPNLVAAVVGGVNKLYWWNGAAWVAII